MPWYDRVRPGSVLFVPEDCGRYAVGEVIRRDGSVLQIEIVDTGEDFSLDLEDLDIPLLWHNDKVVDDMTELHHLHVPAILYNLEERSLKDMPYTFLGGSVLVSVNPLRPVKEPAVTKLLGTKRVIDVPHPYAIAERAYQQLLFANKQAKSNKKDSPVNQSVVVSGESGAGKTESAKMVLKHLVRRCQDSISEGVASEQEVDQRLLDSNPITEAFGNAATKRNHNSSRFGKFLVVHFGSNGRGALHLDSASVETYLLERSRVVSHQTGERNYHVFYQLIAGSDKRQRAALGLGSAYEYAYLVPTERSAAERRRSNGHRTKRDISMRRSMRLLESKDGESFEELCASLETIGLPRQAAPADAGDTDVCDQHQLFAALAALLHLGNVEFEDDDSGGGVANPEPLRRAAELLGVEEDRLRSLVTERTLKAVGEEITVKRNAFGAKVALDSVAKSVYQKLFDWLIWLICAGLGRSGPEPADSVGSIGVLDIFGFESFAENGLEQLLINYTNEALQSCFNRQIFDAEAALFRQEGLLDSADVREPPPENSLCLAFLTGRPTGAPTMTTRGAKKAGKPGLMAMIDAESKSPQPLDEKMNAALHRAFQNHTSFPTPHPRDLRTTFNVRHYAGVVKYTVGQFIDKNTEAVPPQTDKIFANSTSGVVKQAFLVQRRTRRPNNLTQKKDKGPKGKATVISGFMAQMDELVSVLEATQCSFIRCVKPNAHMLREENKGGWFDHQYVTKQLENLSIPQTTQVLQGGLPTRIPFDVLTNNYRELLPSDAIKVWKTFGRGDDRAFIGALFYAFRLESGSFKLGHSRAFFKAGMLERLSDVLEASARGEAIDQDITGRFRSFFTRRLFRRALAKVRAMSAFTQLLEYCRERNSAITILQRLARRRLAELQARATLARLREDDRQREAEEADERAQRAREIQQELERKALEASERKQRRARELQLQEENADKAALDLEKKAQQAKEEVERVREYRETLERDEGSARETERAEKERAVAALGGEQAYRRHVSVKFGGGAKSVRVSKVLFVGPHGKDGPYGLFLLHEQQPRRTGPRAGGFGSARKASQSRL